MLGPLGIVLCSAIAGLRVQPAGRLTPAESDVVVRTARIFARAVEVLGEKKKAAHCLRIANRALGGALPISLLDTSAGEHEVEAVLDRIEFGVYS